MVNNPESHTFIETADITSKTIREIVTSGNDVTIQVEGLEKSVLTTRKEFVEALHKSKITSPTAPRTLRLGDGKQVVLSSEQVKEVLAKVNFHDFSMEKLSHVVVEDDSISLYGEVDGYVVSTTRSQFVSALGSSRYVSASTPRSLRLEDGRQLLMTNEQIKAVESEMEYNRDIRSRIAKLELSGINTIQYLDYSIATNISVSGGRVKFDGATGPTEVALLRALQRVDIQEYQSQGVIQLLCPSSSNREVLNVVSVTRAQFDKLDHLLKANLEYQFV